MPPWLLYLLLALGAWVGLDLAFILWLLWLDWWYGRRRPRVVELRPDNSDPLRLEDAA